MDGAGPGPSLSPAVGGVVSATWGGAGVGSSIGWTTGGSTAWTAPLAEGGVEAAPQASIPAAARATMKSSDVFEISKFSTCANDRSKAGYSQMS